MQSLQQLKENSQQSQQPKLDANGWPIGFLNNPSVLFLTCRKEEWKGKYEDRLELE
ncbi:MAG: hypothetical protein ACXW1Z_25665 [Methylobacter sp.]